MSVRKSLAEILSNVLTEAACAIVLAHVNRTETTKILSDNEKHENK